MSYELRADTRAQGLRLLQDLCLAREILPGHYWLTGVKKGTRLSGGGEATIFQGSYEGETIVIRQFHPPKNDLAARTAKQVGVLI